MDLTCTECHAEPAMAIKPGKDDVTCELFGQVLIVKRGVPYQCWCKKCWDRRFGRVQ